MPNHNKIKLYGLFDAALITRKKDVSGFHVLVRLYIC